MLLEQPNDPTWQESTAELLKAVDEAGKKLVLDGREDRRGDFKTIAYGVSYGGGQTVSSRFTVHDIFLIAVDSLQVICVQVT